MSMDCPDKTFSELAGLVRSWLPWRSEPSTVSRDFWMPDSICRVCYECDTQFTVFNRKHHCRHCGRVFCGKCTANSVPVPCSDSSTSREERERIRVCNYCFKLWEQGVVSSNNEVQVSSLDLSPSPSTASLTSPTSSVTVNSSTTSIALASYAAAPYQRTQQGSGVSLRQSSLMETDLDRMAVATSERCEENTVYSADQLPIQYRSDDDDDYYDYYGHNNQCDSETRYFPEDNDYYGHADFDIMSNGYESQKACFDGENAEVNNSESSPLQNCVDIKNVEQSEAIEKKEYENDASDEGATASSIYAAHNVEAEPVDFDNGLLWTLPEPEDIEDERENDLLDDDDEGDGTGEWGSLSASGSFGSGESRNRERPIEEHKKVIKNVVDGHFRALVAQLLQVENVPVGEEGDEEGWLEIITSLSWEAATLLKPDMSKSGGMDPGGYVKIKCLASGKPYNSMVVKGVVCKKNVAHRRMTSKIEKARLLILEGALEYQRVTNHLSSFDTLLQQEMDHLKMAIAKIDAHHPSVLLVEKSVSRYAQDYLLAKNISLVLNIKRPLLERISRCTGAQIVPSVDHLSSPTLGYCDAFHVDRILEEHGSAGQNGKKSIKTLMFFEGCPKPLGCTILLRGANGDELKKVKHVIQYGVFAAYHLALETSFLADEGASLPELPMSSPITVALPDKASSIVRSISTVPGFSLSTDGKPQGSQLSNEPLRSLSVPSSVLTSSVNSALVQVKEVAPSPSIPTTVNSRSIQPEKNLPNSTATISFDLSDQTAGSCHLDNIVSKRSKEKKEIVSKLSLEVNFSPATNQFLSCCEPLEGTADNFAMDATSKNVSIDISQQLRNSDGVLISQGNKDHSEETGILKEEFPPSPADHQSILVSLSSRCMWKGTVCEKSHLFRIKYYGNFDKPLGRFLRDDLFGQNFQCRSCEEPSEAHVRCYTHQQGTLTISVKRFLRPPLSGEKEGKIWMWHRCLRCPRLPGNGCPPATKRVVMSDAAWGLSFGKFLELSFSNHAAASRVASCGHSLHRDCLRFYGFGEMVACFRYASIDVHSVHVPPATLDFNYDNQEWIREEITEVVNRAELLFSDVLNALARISERSCMKKHESRYLIADLEEMLQKEKAEFEESLQNTLNREAKNGQPAVDIFDINRLRRQLIFQSYMWDHRLIYVANPDKNTSQDGLAGSISACQDRSLSTDTKLTGINSPVDPSKGFSNCDSCNGDIGINKSLNQGQKANNINQSDALHRQVDLNLDISCKKESQSPNDQTSPLESSSSIRRALSEGQAPLVTNLSDTLDAAWTGENQSGTLLSTSSLTDSSTTVARVEGLNLDDRADYRGGLKPTPSVSPKFFTKGSVNMEDSVGWFKMPFYNFYCSLNKNIFGSAQKFDALREYRPKYISHFLDSELQGGARLLLPVGINDTVLPVFDDEPTSIISYALMSPEYHAQMSDEGERSIDSNEVSTSFMTSDSVNQSLNSLDGLISDPQRSTSSVEGSLLSMSGSRGSGLDPLSYTKALHARVNFTDESPQGKVKYSVTCYYGKRFEALRKISCPSELAYVRSLSRCMKWEAQGGKSGVYFAKTLDDRFIIKQVTKTELESFLKFASEYFKYISESIRTCSPTCLAKILGIYQVTAKHLKAGKETKLDVLIMENLLFNQKVTRIYDLKGSARSRYNPDATGSNKVLLDQNLIEAMLTSPIFVGNKAKRLLDRAVWNDTSFLASIDVMDYSLLVGIDEQKHELVLGIIDFMRKYTWDKHLETWVKTSGILGGPRNTSPTVISPKQYKKRFRKAMTTYFLMVPDQWSPLTILPIKTIPESCEENAQSVSAAE